MPISGMSQITRPIPVLIYNAPQFTALSASAALLERLAAHENIAGMKESSGHLPLQAEVRRRVPERFKILVGSAPTLVSQPGPGGLRRDRRHRLRVACDVHPAV